MCGGTSFGRSKLGVPCCIPTSKPRITYYSQEHFWILRMLFFTWQSEDNMRISFRKYLYIFVVSIFAHQCTWLSVSVCVKATAAFYAYEYIQLVFWCYLLASLVSFWLSIPKHVCIVGNFNMYPRLATSPRYTRQTVDSAYASAGS